MHQLRPASCRSTLWLPSTLHRRASFSCLLHPESCASPQDIRCLAGIFPRRAQASRPHREIQGEEASAFDLLYRCLYNTCLRHSGSLSELLPIRSHTTLPASIHEHLFLLSWGHQSKHIDSTGGLQARSSDQHVLLHDCHCNWGWPLSVDNKPT